MERSLTLPDPQCTEHAHPKHKCAHDVTRQKTSTRRPQAQEHTHKKSGSRRRGTRPDTIRHDTGRGKTNHNLKASSSQPSKDEATVTNEPAVEGGVTGSSDHSGGFVPTPRQGCCQGKRRRQGKGRRLGKSSWPDAVVTDICASNIVVPHGPGSRRAGGGRIGVASRSRTPRHVTQLKLWHLKSP